MLLKSVALLVMIVLVFGDENVKRVKRAKYYSYPSRFYRKPPPPHVIKGPFSHTPPPSHMQDEPSYKHKVSKKPTNDGLGDADISNIIKHLSKKDLDKIVEFAGEKERYTDNYRNDSGERFEYIPSLRRPERNSGYRNEGVEQFAENIQHFKEQDERVYKIEYNDPNMNVKPRILYPTPPTFSDDFNQNANSNFVNDASQPKVIYTNPPENYKPKFTNTNPQEQSISNRYPNIMHSNSQGQFPNSEPSFSNTNQQHFLNNNPSSNSNILHSNSQALPSNTHSNFPLDTEESMRQYISYVTVPPNYNTDEKESIFTDSNTMKEEQLPKPLNLRDEYVTANTDYVPKVIKSDGYKVESLKDIPLMNYHDSKLHTVSSYNVPHYIVTSTKSHQTSQQTAPHQASLKPPSIEQAPPGYSGKDQSDAHLKAIKIWTHRSKGTAYTLHDDGTLSLEKPRVKTNYGYVN